MDVEGEFDLEQAVRLLVGRREAVVELVQGHQGGALDQMRTAVVTDRRRPAGQHVLHPVGVGAVRQRNHEAVVGRDGADGVS